MDVTDKRYLYKITNTVNQKVYIGQTKRPSDRWSKHKSKARSREMHPLYDSMFKYGIEKFEFLVIGETSGKFIDEFEVLAIHQYSSTNSLFGYNLQEGGQLSRVLPKENRRKQKKRKTGYKTSYVMSPERKLFFSQLHKGNKYRLGFKSSEETKEKLKAINTGKVASKETVDKMSKSMIGKNKGPDNGMYGTRSNHAKLTLEQAERIRALYKVGDVTLLSLATKFGVSKKTILNIIHNRIYRI